MTRFGRSGYKINFQVAGLLWDYRYRKMTTGTEWDYTIDYRYSGALYNRPTCTGWDYTMNYRYRVELHNIGLKAQNYRYRVGLYNRTKVTG